MEHRITISVSKKRMCDRLPNSSVAKTKLLRGVYGTSQSVTVVVPRASVAGSSVTEIRIEGGELSAAQ